MSAEEQKRAAAERAALLAQDGMVVGLGSGTTAELLIEALGRRHAEGLRFTGVPTSRQTAHLAQTVGIPLTRLDVVHALDLTIDGADEVAPNLDLIKGHGGQLMREKLVASAAHRFIIIVDASKRVSRLGERSPIPVEVVTYGWTTTAHRLEDLGLAWTIRGGEHPFMTSNHNYILDCRCETDMVPTELADGIKRQTGVVDHGLFLGMASTVIVGLEGGNVEVLGDS